MKTRRAMYSKLLVCWWPGCPPMRESSSKLTVCCTFS